LLPAAFLFRQIRSCTETGSNPTPIGSIGNRSHIIIFRAVCMRVEQEVEITT